MHLVPSSKQQRPLPLRALSAAPTCLSLPGRGCRSQASNPACSQSPLKPPLVFAAEAQILKVNACKHPSRVCCGDPAQASGPGFRSLLQKQVVPASVFEQDVVLSSSSGGRPHLCSGGLPHGGISACMWPSSLISSCAWGTGPATVQPVAALSPPFGCLLLAGLRTSTGCMLPPAQPTRVGGQSAEAPLSCHAP